VTLSICRLALVLCCAGVAQMLTPIAAGVAALAFVIWSAGWQRLD
jgi:hypothetical protein